MFVSEKHQILNTPLLLVHKTQSYALLRKLFAVNSLNKTLIFCENCIHLGELTSCLFELF